MSAVTSAVSGLQAAADQLTASASNVANAGTVGPWGPATRVGSASGAGFKAYQPQGVALFSAPGGGVADQAYTVSPATRPAYDPSSPAADTDGMVAEPNVDLNREITGQIGALAYYRANLATLRVADEMQKTLLAIV